MKRTLSLLLALTLALGLLGGCGKETVVEKFADIGLVEARSGKDALGGNQERLGVEFARTVKPEAIINGERHTVRLVEKDTESSIEKTVYAARELAEAGVAAVIGSYGDAYCNVIASELEKANIPLLGPTCTDATTTVTHPNFFRVCNTDIFQAKMLAQYAYEYGARLVYCLAQSDRAYDRMMCQTFIDEFKAMGGTLITSVTEIEYNTYTTNLNNFADYLSGAVNNKADLMFAPIPAKKGAQLVGECAAANVKFAILGDDTWDDASVSALTKETYMMASCATLFAPNRSETTQDFVQNFQDWLRADPARIEANGGTDAVSAAAALAYDAYMTAVAALEAANSTQPEVVMAAMSGVVVEGLTGQIAFDAVGDPAKTELYINRADTTSGTWHFEKAQQQRYVAPLESEEGGASA